MKEARPRFRFHKRRTRQKFAIQADARIRPTARRRAMEHVQLIRAIKFRLRFVESDGAA